MKSGPGDNEYEIEPIGEIGLDGVFEGILPGPEPVSIVQTVISDNDTTPSEIDDPLGDIVG